MPDQRRRRSVSQALLHDLLTRQLTGSRALQVVDVGGGTGGVAIVLAELGHEVCVVDPSPDALASLELRTAEHGLSDRITGRQGDAASLRALVGADSTDVVVCHRVLEVVDSPAEALAVIASVLRPGGRLSLLVGQRHSAVLGHALAGHLTAARRAWTDPARLDRDAILALVAAAGLRALEVDGIGAVADHVPAALVESDPSAYAELYALESEIAHDPAFQALAPVLHVLAERPAA